MINELLRKKTIVLEHNERINKNTILNSNGPLTGSHDRHVGSSSAAIGRGREFRIRMFEPHHLASGKLCGQFFYVPSLKWEQLFMVRFSNWQPVSGRGQWN